MFGQKNTLLEHSFFILTFFGLPIIGGIVIIFMVKPYIYTYALGSAIGMALILKAKFPALKRGEIMSYGSKNMAPSDRNLYWIGYAIIALTVGGGLFLYLQ